MLKEIKSIFLKKAIALVIFSYSILTYNNAQVAINADGSSPDASAMLEIVSTDRGMLVPRMSTNERDAINDPADGLLIYDTDENSFWYFDKETWNEMGTRPGLSKIQDFEVPEVTDMLSGGDRHEAMANSGHNFFYIENDKKRLISVDGSDPSALLSLDTLDFSNSFSFYFMDIAISGNYAYIIHRKSSTGTLSVVDISDPANLSIVSTYSPGGEVYTSISIQGNYAYVMESQNAELLVLDLSAPTAPVEIGSLDGFPAQSPGRDTEVLVADNYTYIFHALSESDSEGRISIVDISDPTSPIITGTTATNNVINRYDQGPYRLGLYNDHLYLCDLDVEWMGDIIEVSDPSNPVLVGDFGDTHGFPYAFDIANSYLYTAFENQYGSNFFGVLDLSDPAVPVSVFDEVPDYINYMAAFEVIIEDNIAFILTDEALVAYKISTLYTEATNTDGSISYEALYDEMGDHTASRNIKLNGYWLSHDGDNEGVYVDESGQVGIGTSSPMSTLEVNGTVTATAFSGDGSALTNVGTDNQTIDVLNLNGSTLEISLQDDGEPTKTLDLSAIDTNTDTDDQTIDVLNLNGSTLEISLQDDGETTKTLDLSAIDTNTDTDDQTIDVLNLNGSTLEISLQDDGESTKTLDLSAIDTNTDTDDQTIDVLNLNGNTLEISLQDDGESTKTLDLNAIDTDNQQIDVLNLNGSTLELSLQDDGVTTKTLDLSSLAPVGAIQMWPTTTPPSGWLICNGSTFNASNYPDLNTVLGGNTLPNFSGRFPLGVGNSGTSGAISHGISSTGGAETHVLTINEMPSHNHGITYSGKNKSGSGGEVSDLESSSSTEYTQSTGGNQAHNNMPPFYTINFIIKAE